MSRNSIIFEKKSYELISLISELEKQNYNKDEKNKIIEMIGRLLIHTSITLDHFNDENRN